MTRVNIGVSPNHFVVGERVSSPAIFQVISPIDEQPLLEIGQGGSDIVGKAVSAAAGAFSDWAELGAERRHSHVIAIADRLQERADEIATVECLDAGIRFRCLREEMVPGEFGQLPLLRRPCSDRC